MRRALITASVVAVAALGSVGTASAAGYNSCSDINTKIGGKNYKIAIHVQAKGVGCSSVKKILISFATSNPIEPADSTLEALKKRCKADKNQQAATKKGRTAYTCTSANGKRSIKAWVMNG